MEIRAALKEQYHAGMAMLRQCIDRCPDPLWTSGEHPRNYWRIAYHSIYFTHVYLMQNEESFQPWPGRKPGFDGMWQKPWDLEPYELPEDAEVYDRSEMLAYLDHVDRLIDPTIFGLDLATDASGFSWYENSSKISHQLMNLRHIQGHVGQLSELLMAKGIEIDWVSRATDAMHPHEG